MIHKNTKRHSRKMAFTLAWIIFFQAMLPLQGLALTSGPSQPEFSSFEPVGTTQMVDPFTGSFVYNIPLFELPGPDGGYPFNLSYKPDGNINSESGPFGYGWTINPGVITRDVRGIPDDHNGDNITEMMSMRDNWTAGANFAGNIEGLGLGGLNTGFGIYYNSYRGVGVNATAGVALPLGDNLNLGLSADFDSKEGFNVSPSVGIGGIFNASTSINSRRGMSGLSLTFSLPLGEDVLTGSSMVNGRVIPTIERKKSGGGMKVFGAGISLAGGSHSPSLQMPWKSFSLSGQVKLGASLFGIFGNGSVSGNFNRQKLKFKGEDVIRNGYGYMYLENAGVSDDLLDFSREKDGSINKNTPNLGIPSSSPDIYTATGQGMAGMFRPYRSDIGIVYDPATSSNGGGGSFTLDAPVLHAGGSGNISFSNNTANKWGSSNSMLNNFDFSSAQDNDIDYEPYYFKTQGEKVAEPVNALKDHVGGEEPLRPQIDQLSATGSYVDKNKDVVNIAKPVRDERKPRGLVIQDFTNSIADNIPLMNSDIYDYDDLNSNPMPIASIQDDGDLIPTPYNRITTGDKGNHIGGFISTDTKGARYVYGIPAYNNKKEECVFSVPESQFPCDPLTQINTNSSGDIQYDVHGSEEYFKRTQHAPFAHSFLLTSVLGADYIDVKNDGPTVDDIGYWVKFNYAKVHENFKWRSPYDYTKAFYDKGITPKTGDEKGSFSYGEKEIWMLGTVETKTHVAVFLMDSRADGLEAYGDTKPDGSSDPSRKELHRVKEIRLFTRSEWEDTDDPTPPKPLRTVVFDYDYLISGDVPNSNSNATDPKKLTLTDVWFKSENSDRGMNNKYSFDYGTDELNPPYSPTGFDRWGNYFEKNEGECGNIDFPYTQQVPDMDYDQDGDIDPEDLVKELADNSAVWNLKNITLPSGSEIKIKWEPHRYSYVQNQEVTQMVKIAGLDPQSSSDNSVLDPERPEDFVRIYFEMEPNTSPDDYIQYLPQPNRTTQLRQLYFKARVKLFKDSSIDEYQDISGYLDVKEAGSEGGLGFVDVLKLNPEDADNPINHHPFAVYAWQFMKQQLSDRLFAFPAMSADATESQAKGIVTKLANSVMSVINFFGGFYNSCESKGFAQKIDLDHSYLKLCAPDKEKFGGGARVAQIELHDAWESETTYGQHYTYYDGVATNEPSIGGDENPLRYAKTYSNNLLMATDEVNFFEFPINENLYPGPSIGYSKVEVTSLATHLGQLKKSNPNDYTWLPDGFSTTGKVVHEFYTAKDFPVIVDETTIDLKTQKNFAPLFPMGSFNEELLTSSQGYSIIKNDMHGKAKKISNFAQDINGDFLPDPYNYVQYSYKHDAITHNGKEILKLDNEADVLLDFDPPENIGDAPSFDMPQGKRLIGVDYEMINDMRENNSIGSNIGGQFNVDVLPFPPGFPLPSLWFTVGTNTTKVKTASTNKMIFKSGILKSVTAFDGGSTVETNNLLFDPYTGEALLTSLTNEYGDPVYNLNVPGHMVYDEMGAAYIGLGLYFQTEITSIPDLNLWKNSNPINIINDLNVGDEFSIDGYKGTATIVKMNSDVVFSLSNNNLTPPTNATFRLIKKSNGNYLINISKNIVANSNPTKDIDNENCGISFEYGYLSNPSPICIQANVDYAKDFMILFNEMIEDIDGDGFKDLLTPGLGADILNGPPIFNYYQNYITPSMLEVIENAYGPLFEFRIGLIGGVGGYQGPIIVINGVHSGISRNFFSNEIPCDETVGIGEITLSEWEGIKEISFIDNNGSAICRNLSGCYINYQMIHKDNQGVLDTISISAKNFVGFPATGTFLPPSQVVVTSTNLTIDHLEINDAVQISANSLSPNAMSYNNDGYSELMSEVSYKPYRSYSYLDNRTGLISAEPKLVSEGLINDVSLFNFKDPFFSRCTDSKWVETSTVTQFDKGNEVENKDALGIYSAALFGHNSDLSIATGQNARYLELGFENFENFEPGFINNQEPNIGSHLDFVPNTHTTYQSFELISGKKDVIILDVPFHESFQSVKKVDLLIKFRDGSSQMVHANVVGGVTQDTDQDPNVIGNTLMALEYLEGCEPAPANGNPFDNEIWAGTVYIPKTSDFGIDGTTLSVFNDLGEVPVRAHSGNQYLNIPADTDKFMTLQTLRLQPEKKYHVSAWVARNKMHPNMPVMVKVNDEPLEMTSDIIDGWIKVEKTFIAAIDGKNIISFHADPITTYNANGTATTQSSPLYLDDIRIQPAQSSMVTYVYDPVNYRLMASLDENNYATFYEYDHEGRLTTVKKETERGIKTIQHNQSYLAEQSE